MNKIIFADGKAFQSVPYPFEIEPSIFDKKARVNEEYREVLRITVESNYEDMNTYFVDYNPFVIREHDLNPETGEELETYTDYDKSDYCLAGEIIDHRNGHFTVYMAKLTEHERAVEALEMENAELLFNNLTGEDFSEFDDLDEEIIEDPIVDEGTTGEGTEGEGTTTEGTGEATEGEGTTTEGGETTEGEGTGEGTEGGEATEGEGGESTEGEGTDEGTEGGESTEGEGTTTEGGETTEEPVVEETTDPEDETTTV